MPFPKIRLLLPLLAFLVVGRLLGPEPPDPVELAPPTEELSALNLVTSLEPLQFYLHYSPAILAQAIELPAEMTRTYTERLIIMKASHRPVEARCRSPDSLTTFAGIQLNRQVSDSKGLHAGSGYS